MNSFLSVRILKHRWSSYPPSPVANANESEDLLRHWVNCVIPQQKTPLENRADLTAEKNYLRKMWKPDVSGTFQPLFWEFIASSRTVVNFCAAEDMIILTYLFLLLWEEAQGWGFKDGIFHNSIWLGKKLPSWGFFLGMSILWKHERVGQSSKNF